MEPQMNADGNDVIPDPIGNPGPNGDTLHEQHFTTAKPHRPRFGDFDFWSFELVSDFDIRI